MKRTIFIIVCITWILLLSQILKKINGLKPGRIEASDNHRCLLYRDLDLAFTKNSKKINRLKPEEIEGSDNHSSLHYSALAKLKPSNTSHQNLTSPDWWEHPPDFYREMRKESGKMET